MPRPLSLALPLLLLLHSPAQADAPTQVQALRDCRAIAQASARLACYDALPLSQAVGAVAGTSAATPPGSGAALADKVAAFGLPRQPGELDTITSHIPGLFEGWDARSRLTLANGQVWQIADDSSAYLYLRDAQVVLRRGALGAIYLDIAGTNRSPRVRRVQ